jgi:putative ABC transport system permease protein
VAVPLDSVWAVGPGAPEALDAVAARTPGTSVATYADELQRRRDAALPSAVGALAGVSCALLLVLGLLGVALAAAAEAPARATSIGRLRALGASDRDLRRTLLGELVTPVLVAAVTGLAVGIGCACTALGALSLESLTAAPGPPAPAVPWWTVLFVVLLAGCAVALALLDRRRARGTPLAELLRA